MIHLSVNEIDVYGYINNRPIKRVLRRLYKRETLSYYPSEINTGS